MPVLPKNSQAAAKQTSRAQGQAAEDAAWHYLRGQGLRLLQRNYRTPGRGGGEIDLICQEPDGTVVFVEVRSRQSQQFGGALASIGWQKQQRIIRAASHWLLRFGAQRACRFDVIAVQGGQIQWLPGAFDASAAAWG